MKEGNTITEVVNRRGTVNGGIVEIAALLVAVAFLGYARMASAATLTAGTCQSGGYASIQLAVNAAASGDTVQVCPGTWKESVEIFNKNITLVGLGTGVGRPTLVYPTDVDKVCLDDLNCPQVWVQGSSSTTVKNLIIDGSELSAPACNDPIGILFQDSTGIATGNTISNHFRVCSNFPVLPGAVGDGIDVVYTAGVSAPNAKFSATISNNIISSFGHSGVKVNAGLRDPGLEFDSANSDFLPNLPQVDVTGSVTGNTLTGNSLYDALYIWAEATDSFRFASNKITAGGNSEGVEVWYGSGPTVTENTIDDIAEGVGIEGTTYATVNFNKMTNITNNGVNFGCASTSSIGFNTISGLSEDGQYLDLAGIELLAGCPQGGSDHNTIVLNTIKGFCAGILEGPSAQDFDNNIVANVFQDIGPGSDLMAGDTCP